MSRVLLLSTYELGGRPLGCTVPAAALAAAGHEVRAVDLALDPWPSDELATAQAVTLSVPMHTALRLALEALGRLRRERPDLPVCLHGLYAEAGAQAAGPLLGPGDVALSGEVLEPLVEWASEIGAERAGTGPRRRRELGAPRGGSRAPMTSAGLAGLEQYAQLSWKGEQRLVATVETTTGCSHRCRHCPVPVVYEGRSRPVALETVRSELAALIEEGASHVHLADPDFLNRPSHARAFARMLKRDHPGRTFDATIKVSHLLRHRDLLPELADAGLLFVVSALESTSDLVLERLDKGHRSSEGREAVRLLRSLGVEVRPSFLPFTPWTTRQDLVDLLDFVAEEDLVWSVDPVQYGIRLLLPPGSLLLEPADPVLAACLLPPEPGMLGTGWRAPDPLLDECQRALAALVEEAAAGDGDTADTYLEVRALVHRLL
ncbi:MAG: Fe-S oxidoreductase, partial [Acidimicrobiaceae bacterium]|nr:Fe-S oxidoreductase [Acidimicrobiaceae bacterium]